MTLVAGSHTDHGATFGDRGGRSVVEEYGRPDRAVRAVRNAVGVIEMGYGVVVVTGSDRRAVVDDAVTNDVPHEDGGGCYALALDSEGAIETELFVYDAGRRLLLFTPPGRDSALTERLGGDSRDADVRDATTEFGVFGVHGPMATEKIASVLHKAGAPTGAYSFVRGSMGDAGVSVVAGDAPGGEESYEVICAADDAAEVWTTLLSRGNGAAPFGYQTYETLTLESGTPLFESEIRGERPGTLGLTDVAGVAGGAEAPTYRLVGLDLGADAEDSLPPAGTPVVGDDGVVGELTRARRSPSLSTAIAFARVERGETVRSVRTAAGEMPATRTELPFVEGSDRSRRLPSY
ncbi:MULTISPECIES: glycine cleavage T C-terminal barrel domain-containing protein [Halolamina]|uniref:Aminomethyltransferase n=1 Tax=Halolamina pelagica TaxID=699431 RepID=A0A1I5RY20_9EURY|nr:MULTISPECIES: glycine cleavage T C-terminal barrel domain-containing protein [Halolamina]NHX35400.1 aminomethyl transferase family protein [Halolamina sp. R1-12]SFP63330.1 aminomethyltransferase [Halolamina pelagica]